MKKGLLSILAASAVLVGCQNYDDQFDALNTQITQLKSTVDGLTGVQTTINALQSDLDALAAAALTQTDLDAALTAGLEDITNTVGDIETELENVANSDELSAVASSVADAQEDLDELLTSNNVYNEDVIVNTKATLTWAAGLGAKLTIVNGDVVFDVNQDMADMTDDEGNSLLQSVINRFRTVTGQFSYYATSSTVSASNFDLMIGVGDLEVAQGGPISFAGLQSAETVTLGDNYQNSVSSIAFPALTSVDAFQTRELVDNGGAAAAGYITSTGTGNGITFNKATMVDLSSLPRYGSAVLEITIKQTATSSIHLDAMTSTNEDGEVISSRTLRLSGAGSFTSDSFEDGEIEVSNMDTVHISNFYGTIDINGGVETLTVDRGVTVDITGATDLTSATLDIELDWDPSRTTAATKKDNAQSLNFNSTDLEYLHITGTAGDITLDSESNLTDLILAVDAKDLTLDELDDLTEVTVTGSKFTDVTMTNNDDITEIDFDHAFDNGGVTTDKAATVVIQNNNNLLELTWSADKVNALTVEGNDDLATVDFDGLALIGEATATANIRNNDLSASNATDAWGDNNGDDDDADTGEGEGSEEGTSVDDGSYTTESGLGSLKTWLEAADGVPGAAGIIVAFDDIEVAVDEADTTANSTETNNPTFTASDEENVHYVVYITADGDDTNAKYQTQTFFVPVAAASLDDVNGSQGINTSEFDAAADAITVDYPISPNKVISWDADDAANIADFMSHFNDEADLDGFDLTIEQTGKYQKTYLVNYVDTDGTGGSVSAAGSVLFAYGSETSLTIPAASLTAGDGEADLAGLLADRISELSSYTATGEGVDGYAYVVVSPRTDDEDDVTPIRRNSLPNSITISRTGGSVSWSANATNAETSFTLSIGAGAARYAGFIITAKNTNQAVNRSITNITGASFFGTSSQLSAASFYDDGNVDGSSSTTVLSEIGDYVRDFDDVVLFQGGADGEDTNRISWL